MANHLLFHWHRQLLKGSIIVIEGTDKAGKGTQSRLLMEFFKRKSIKCALFEFPDYSTPIGMEIKAFLDGRRKYSFEVQHMLLSANRWEKKKEIEDLVYTGHVVVMNRYYQSNLAYGIAHGIDLQWLLNLDIGLPKENLVIVLRVKPDTSYKRVNQNRDAFEKDRKLMDRVNENYQTLAEKFNWRILDGEGEIKDIHTEISRIVKTVVKV